MTRRPPTILSALATDGGGIEVRWEVDSFFPDSAEPEKVLVDLNGRPFKELDGDEHSVTIPKETLATLGTSSAAISISFWWSGSPPEEQQTSVVIPVHTENPGGGGGGVFPAARPVVTVVGVQPRTLQAANSITIAWRSNNYNDGNIFWGPSASPRAFQRNIRPRGEVYHGTFITDQILTSATNYSFTVEVRNTLHSPGWIGTTAVVRSAANFRSLRRFLQASGVALPAALDALLGAERSLRRWLQV
jgi:hypothetical protein